MCAMAKGKGLALAQDGSLGPHGQQLSFMASHSQPLPLLCLSRYSHKKGGQSDPEGFPQSHRVTLTQASSLMFLWRQRACFQRSFPLLISSSFHKILFWCLNGCCVSVETQRKHLLKCLAHLTALSSHEMNLGEMGPDWAGVPGAQGSGKGYHQALKGKLSHCPSILAAESYGEAEQSTRHRKPGSLQRSQVGSCTSGMKEAARGLF